MSGAAVVGFARWVGDVLQEHGIGEHPGELHLFWVDQRGDGLDTGLLPASLNFLDADENWVSACATEFHCEGVEQDPAGGEVVAEVSFGGQRGNKAMHVNLR